MIFRKKYLLLKHFTSLTCAVLGSVMESCLSVLHWACRTCSHWAHRGNIPPLKRVRAEETFTDTSSRRKMHRITWNMRRSLSTTRGIHSPVTGENWPEACLLNTATWEWAKTSREHLPTYLPTYLRFWLTARLSWRTGEKWTVLTTGDMTHVHIHPVDRQLASLHWGELWLHIIKNKTKTNFCSQMHQV